jgi:hypothetical protein
MIEIIRDIVGNTEVREFPDLARIAGLLNEEIPTIRKCEHTYSEAPYGCINYVYFMFVIRAWSILEKVLPCIE